MLLGVVGVQDEPTWGLQAQIRVTSLRMAMRVTWARGVTTSSTSTWHSRMRDLNAFCSSFTLPWMYSGFSRWNLQQLLSLDQTLVLALSAV